MKIQFQTNRQYSKDGQRIVCMTHEAEPHKGILFFDMDRGIDGFIPLVKVPTDNFALREQTLHNYDYGNYCHIPFELWALKTELLSSHFKEG